MDSFYFFHSYHIVKRIHRKKLEKYSNSLIKVWILNKEPENENKWLKIENSVIENQRLYINSVSGSNLNLMT